MNWPDDYVGKILQGDCLEVMKGIPDGAVDLLLTDIPYNCSQKSAGLRRLDYGDWDKGFNIADIRKDFLRLPSAAVCVWSHETQVSYLLEWIRSANMIDRPLCWVKPNPTVLNGDKIWQPGFELAAFGKVRGGEFNLRCHKGYWIMPPDADRYHPNQKPLRIFKDIILATTSLGDLILDPFLGSGTTAVACVETGRRFIGVELDPGYCAIARRRVSEAREQQDLFRKPETVEQTQML